MDNLPLLGDPGTRILVPAETTQARLLPSNDETGVKEVSQGPSDGNSNNHYSDATNTKRKLGVRACDACSIRKVRCELQRPCSHCVANGLQCTLLRQRKKLGPKNLHKKTLKLIRTLVPTKELLLPETSASETPLSEPYLLTPQNLQENLGLICEEPILFELLKPFTVQLLVINFTELIQFLTVNFPGDAMDREIIVVEYHNDNVFLLTLLSILLVNLLIAEILIKLKKQKYRGFIKYLKRHIQERNFKNFKNLAHFKCIEVFSLIEKNFIVPAVIPAQHLAVENRERMSGYNNNLFAVYYNLLLGCLHLCTYYHILNLTNVMNGGDTPSIGHYGNEQQEQQKLIFFRRSLTYYQLLNLKSALDHAAAAVQLYEMFEMLYTWERYMLLYLLTTYSMGLRNNDITFQLDRAKYRNRRMVNIDNAFDKNVLFELIELIDKVPGLMEKLGRLTFQLIPGHSSANEYPNLRDQVIAFSQDAVFEVIKQVMLFKLICVLGHWLAAAEVDRILAAITSILATLDLDAFKVQMLNYQLLPQLLHMMRARLELGNAIDDIMVAISDNVIPHFPHFNNINKLIRASPQLYNWFSRLNQARDRLKQKRSEQLPTASHNGIMEQGLPAPQYPPAHIATEESLPTDWDIPMSELLNNLFNLFTQISEEASQPHYFGLSTSNSAAESNSH